MSMAKVMIVDDSPTEVHVLTTMLTKNGHGSDSDGCRHAGNEWFSGDTPDIKKYRNVIDTGHNGHYQRSGNRQGMGDAPGRQRLHR